MRMLISARAAVFALAALVTVQAFGVTAGAAGGSEPTPRVVMPLSTGWRFKQASGLGGVEGTQFDDSDWDQVTVPHTWNRIGNEGTVRSPQSNNTQGTGWYRLRFEAPAAAKRSRYFLQFDAVATIADVWLNGHYLGKHEGAFARFRFDASTAINPTGDNLLVVRADNSRPQPGSTTQNVIPLSGDFFMFGGIYRSAALIVTQPVHLDLLDFGGPGVYERSLTIQPGAAAVQVTSRVVNDEPTPQRLRVETAITAADGKVVASRMDAAGPVAPGAVSIVQSNLDVTNPRLWQGLRDPYLYRTVVTLRSMQGAVLDRVTQPLGLRTVRFDANNGFFLNGEHQYLKGASMHQDRPAKGWAVSDADQEEDFAILADLGANAVRLAHYQHDQRSYEAADVAGIVVWAEIPLVNKVSFDGSAANAALAANARQQLLELIQQNRNHPCVALWSIANEIDLTATQVHGPSKPGSLLRSLNALAKSQDPDRPSTFADCCEVALPPHANDSAAGADGAPGVAPREAIVGIADTVGYNRYFGWYTGHFGDFGPMLDQAHERHPQVPMSVSEYGAGAALTQHSDDPTGGPINPHGRPHPEEMQNLYHEMSWSALRQRPYLWGSFIWNLIDFASDSRQEGDLTDINEKGLVSYDRKIRKDTFYFYRANWSQQPTLHLVGRRYVDRPYAVLDVKAYSNATRANLTVNGTDEGATSCADGICVWRAIHLQPGPNELHATATIGGTAVSDSLQWTLSGTPAVVRIKSGDISGYLAVDRQRYGSDMYFSGGEGKGVNRPDTPDHERAEVAASDPRLYDSFREGEFSYRVPVPNGRYKIALKFEEPAAAAGERVFDVFVNGKAVLKRFDIVTAAGGKLRAVDKSVQAKAQDGALLIEFKPVKGQPLIAAVSITPE
ncbi:MAG TPA: glycoside hydrolase family 2 TIM barrel-domain containing protein [Steroidobacteraceae bacterium]|nr:glycoside hydrolase family 2 TIM barrel-domain containing protein [Steroidobacteraceae bacterium]